MGQIGPSFASSPLMKDASHPSQEKLGVPQRNAPQHFHHRHDGLHQPGVTQQNAPQHFHHPHDGLHQPHDGHDVQQPQEKPKQGQAKDYCLKQSNQR